MSSNASHASIVTGKIRCQRRSLFEAPRAKTELSDRYSNRLRMPKATALTFPLDGSDRRIGISLRESVKVESVEWAGRGLLSQSDG